MNNNWELQGYKRIAFGLDKANGGDCECEVRGYWLDGRLHILNVKTSKQKARFGANQSGPLVW